MGCFGRRGVFRGERSVWGERGLEGGVLWGVKGCWGIMGVWGETGLSGGVFGGVKRCWGHNGVFRAQRGV